MIIVWRDNNKKERNNWYTEYLRNIQGCWDNNNDLEIDFNIDPITYVCGYLILFCVPYSNV